MSTEFCLQLQISRLPRLPAIARVDITTHPYSSSGKYIWIGCLRRGSLFFVIASEIARYKYKDVLPVQFFFTVCCRSLLVCYYFPLSKEEAARRASSAMSRHGSVQTAVLSLISICFAHVAVRVRGQAPDTLGKLQIPCLLVLLPIYHSSAVH